MSQESQKRGVMGALLPRAKTPKLDPAAGMSFLDHLEELRWRIFKGLAGLTGGVIIAFIFADTIVNQIILGPARADFFMYQIMPINAIDLSLISRRLPGQFFTYWGSLIIAGGIIGSPILFYQMYAFIEPALESREKIKTYLNVLFVSSFFLLGISFGYLILVPFALQFFTQFVISDLIANEFDITEYFSSVALWVLACGILFQIPVISYFLSKAGMLTPGFLKEYRRQAIIACLLISAFLTPPDPVSQMMIAIPLVLLYQLAIVVSRMANRQREKILNEAFSDNGNEPES
ncbi:MAG: twin-arginine translocase subunit TatC [Balneolaceae bacterium]